MGQRGYDEDRSQLLWNVKITPFLWRRHVIVILNCTHSDRHVYWLTTVMLHQFQICWILLYFRNKAFKSFERNRQCQCYFSETSLIKYPVLKFSNVKTNFIIISADKLIDTLLSSALIEIWSLFWIYIQEANKFLLYAVWVLSKYQKF